MSNFVQWKVDNERKPATAKSSQTTTLIKHTIQVSWYQIVAILDFVDTRMMEEVFLSLSFALRVEPNETELDTWPGFTERIQSAGGILGWRALWKWNAMPSLSSRYI